MPDNTIIELTRSNVSSIAAMLDALIESAHIQRASDIHIDPDTMGGSIRFRVDGLMVQYGRIESDLMSETIGRIKIVAALRGDIHDKSQDGRFHCLVKNRKIDVRVSVAPTYFGENAVLRLLAGENSQLSYLRDIGLSEDQRKLIETYLERSQGMIIVAGPTGAGKTNTLYGMLRQIKSNERLIISLEDPVEHVLRSTRQIQLKSQIGYGFGQALRGVLRQDPDVIMVGEIRDKETASIAVQIALTGHLVVTSIHAEDAAHVIPRLIDMGVDPYLLAATLKVIVSQRLMRKYDFDNHEYRGRTGIFEVMEVTEHIRVGILKKVTASQIEKIALKNGFVSMKKDGEAKVAAGITKMEEVKRVLQ